MTEPAMTQPAMTQHTPPLRESLDEASALHWLSAQGSALLELLQAASALRDRVKTKQVTYSRKVFIPLTTLCRDDCGYCTFKHDPGHPGAKTLSPDEVLAIAEQGRKLGCKEALFSLGDKPELRFPEARETLARFGHRSISSYLVAMSEQVLAHTGLLPHANPGTLSKSEIAALKEHNGSMGVMLENTSPRMRHVGMPHEHAPDKAPRARLHMLRFAGELQFPFTTGLLIGIGETLAERVQTLFQIKALHEEYGHIQEVIVQNFRAKPQIPMAGWPSASFADLLRTIAVTRLVLGGEMNIQAPPNLMAEAYPMLLLAGINDWGGVSPLTPDHINPEAPWPHIDMLARQSAEMGYRLRERLTIYPEYIDRPGFVAARVQPYIQALQDRDGYAAAS